MKTPPTARAATLYRVTLQFRRDAYVAAPSFDDAKRILTSPLVQGTAASVAKVQSLDPRELSCIEQNHPVYTPEGKELGTVLECFPPSQERRRRTWLNCPSCDEPLFLVRGFHLEGERRTCEVCGTTTALVVEERDGENHGSLRVVAEVETSTRRRSP